MLRFIVDFLILRQLKKKTHWISVSGFPGFIYFLLLCYMRFVWNVWRFALERSISFYCFQDAKAKWIDAIWKTMTKSMAVKVVITKS